MFKKSYVVDADSYIGFVIIGYGGRGVFIDDAMGVFGFDNDLWDR